MKRTKRKTDAPKKPSLDVFLTLVNLAAHFGRPWVVVTQAKLLQRLERNTGRTMSRRTLNRHLLALEQRGQIKRTKRHRRGRRYGPLELRATLYTFGEPAKLWISTMRKAVAIPLGRPLCQKWHKVRTDLSKKAPVDETIHRRQSRPPRRARG